MTESITVYTDGSCLYPDGPGGWALVALFPDGTTSRRYGSTPQTTNNRMELTAAIEALELSDPTSDLTIVSDSKYVVDGITKWLPNWKAKGWRKSSPGEISNLDLWQRLDQARTGRNAEFLWVKGHAGDQYNEIADELCGQAARELGPDFDDPISPTSIEDILDQHGISPAVENSPPEPLAQVAALIAPHLADPAQAHQLAKAIGELFP